MNRYVVVLLFMFFNLQCTNSQTAVTEDIVADFFTTYKSNPVNALTELYKFAPWLTGPNEGVDNLKAKFKDLKTTAGEYYGYELLNEKNVKNIFVIYTYLVKHENVPLIFTFEFYKPNNEWTLYSFSYDYNFVGDVKEKIKEELFK